MSKFRNGSNYLKNRECEDSTYTKTGYPPLAALLLLVGLPAGTATGLQYIPKADCTTQAILDHEQSHFATDLATGAEAGAPFYHQQEPTDFWKEKGTAETNQIMGKSSSSWMHLDNVA